MSQQAVNYLRPQVTRTRSLGRAFLKAPLPVQAQLPATFYVPAQPGFYVPSPSPVLPQFFVVYGSPMYSPGFLHTPVYSSRASALHQQQIRSTHSLSHPRAVPPARSHSGATGLGLVDETLQFAPQHTGYVTAYGVPTANAVSYGSGYSGYATSAAASYVADESDAASSNDTASLADSTDDGRLHPGMSVDELCSGIKQHFDAHGSISVSWLNRLFSKCVSPLDFAKALDIFHIFQKRRVETTPETGTLLIKAACRAGVPEKALQLLRDVDHVRLWPTLGGIHYLMINFSIKKDTESVLSTFEATRERQLVPNVRTYHILIRECVDNQRIDEALRFAGDCKAKNIAPNRVMYNILMNGCRKANKPNELLQLRTEMDSMPLELNDTTVKFTVLAHLMLGDARRAAAEFLAFVGGSAEPEAVNAFAERFLDELADEPDAEQHVRLVRVLFDALRDSNAPLSVELLKRLNSLEAQPSSSDSANS